MGGKQKVTKAERREHLANGELWCHRCDSWLAHALFHTKTGKRMGMCRACTRVAVKDWAQNNRAKKLATTSSCQRLKKYGVTPERYAEMRASQQDLCAICGKEEKRGLRIDHDHAIGKIRALLCHKCNVVLGLMNEDPGLIRMAAAYVEKHSFVYVEI